MARNYGHSSWNQWWETEAKKFDALEAKFDWLRSMLEEKCNEMRRLDGEVTRLGQRVSEAENVNAVLERKLADLSVAGASAAGVSEIPAVIATREAEAPGESKPSFEDSPPGHIFRKFWPVGLVSSAGADCHHHHHRHL